MKTLRDFWLGWKDLNPRNDGVRVHCLTAWLHPSVFMSSVPDDFIIIPRFKELVNENLQKDRKKNITDLIRQKNKFYN